MTNAFQDTPRSLLSALVTHEGKFSQENSWQVFYDLYHRPVRIATLTMLKRYGSYCPSLAGEIIADVFVSFFRSRFRYDPSRGKFRNDLWQLIKWQTLRALHRHTPAYHEEETALVETLATAYQQQEQDRSSPEHQNTARIIKEKLAVLRLWGRRWRHRR